MKRLYIILILAIWGLCSIQADNNNQQAYSPIDRAPFQALPTFSEFYSNTQSQSGIGTFSLEMPDGPGTIVNPDNEMIPISGTLLIFFFLGACYAAVSAVRFRGETVGSN